MSPCKANSADFLLCRSSDLLYFKNEETFNDHSEQVGLNGVAGFNETGAVELDNVKAHEGEEVLDELGRLGRSQSLEKLKGRN